MKPEYIIDRNRLKASAAFWRNGAILLLVMFALYMVSGGKNSVAGQDYIAKLSIEGEIMEDQRREKVIENLTENSKVKAVIVQIDSPGGSAFGGESLYNALKKLSDKKPIVSVITGMATSGGYMAAISGEYIVAGKTSLTGSIGALMLTGEISELAKKLGVNFIVAKSGDLKAEPLFTHPLTPQAKQSMQEIVDDTAQVFMQMVGASRKMSLAQVKLLADGRVYTGNQAIKVGLIDEIGGQQEAVNWLVEKKGLSKDLEVKEVVVDSHQSPFERFFIPLRKANEAMATFASYIKILHNGLVLK